MDWAANFVPAIDRVFVARDPEHHRYPLLHALEARSGALQEREEFVR